MKKVQKFSRILLKLSGESLMGPNHSGIHLSTIERICDEIKQVIELGIEVCIVIGAGNIFRGLSEAASDLNRASADYMGMLGTVINSLALDSTLQKKGIKAKILSAIPMMPICEAYSQPKALNLINENYTVIFAAGTGNPFFTTDTAAALRAAEMNCDAIFKGTLVDGVYDSDPKIYSKAKKFTRLSHESVIKKNLKIMDMTAISLAKDNNIPILIFSINHPKGLLNVINGVGTFTIISN